MVETLNSITLIVGCWTMALVAFVVLCGLTWVLTDALGRLMWRRLTRLYDVYVLNWWLHEIKAAGHSIPTRMSVDKLMARVQDIVKEGEGKGSEN